MADNWSKNGLLYRRNPLAYPAGRVPGFDPSHPAGRNNPFSSVALGGSGGGINVLRGERGTVIGTPPSSVDGIIGPYGQFDNNTDRLDFSHTSAVSSTFTFGAIVIWTNLAVGSNQYILVTGLGSSDDWFVGTSVTSGRLFLNNHLTAPTSNLVPTVGVPYFYALSADGSVVNFLLKRLDTGNIQSETVAAATSGVGGAGASVGNFGVARSAGAKIAASMASFSPMSLSQLLQWATDPWAFWYPRQSLNIVSLAAAAASSGNFAVFSTPYDDNRTVTQMIGY